MVQGCILHFARLGSFRQLCCITLITLFDMVSSDTGWQGKTCLW
jgi:hypothetical protein